MIGASRSLEVRFDGGPPAESVEDYGCGRQVKCSNGEVVDDTGCGALARAEIDLEALHAEAVARSRLGRLKAFLLDLQVEAEVEEELDVMSDDEIAELAATGRAIIESAIRSAANTSKFGELLGSSEDGDWWAFRGHLEEDELAAAYNHIHGTEVLPAEPEEAKRILAEMPYRHGHVREVNDPYADDADAEARSAAVSPGSTGTTCPASPAPSAP